MFTRPVRLLLLIGLLLAGLSGIAPSRPAHAQSIPTLPKTPKIILTKSSALLTAQPTLLRTPPALLTSAAQLLATQPSSPNHEAGTPVSLTNVQTTDVGSGVLKTSADLQFTNFDAQMTIFYARAMPVTDSVSIQLIINPSLAAANTPIVAKLQGVNFDISPAGPQSKIALVGGSSTWPWSIRPKSNGNHVLTLDIEIRQGGQIYQLNSFLIAIQVVTPTLEMTFTPSLTVPPTATWTAAPVWTPAPTAIPSEKPFSWLTPEMAAILVALIGLSGGMINLYFQNKSNAPEKKDRSRKR